MLAGGRAARGGAARSGEGAPGVDYCATTGGGGGFRVTADPLLFIYSVSRLFVQTYSERPRAITARRRATPVNSLGQYTSTPTTTLRPSRSRS